jgi:beta-hydroxyacyl-ACP dehydratase FabZ
MEQGRQEMGKGMDVNEIQKIIPHRYPFLLVDRIIEMGDNRIVGLKNVTINEPFFQGHFPGRPIMPGALIIEALAQTAGVYALSRSDQRGSLAYFASIDNAKFRKPVVPGDQLILEVNIVKSRLRILRVQGIAKVNGEEVASADMLFAIMGGGEGAA